MLRRFAEARGERHIRFKRFAEIFRHAFEHRRMEKPRHDRHHADAIARQITRNRQREPHDTALRGRISRLPDLPVLGRHGRRAHHNAAPTIGGDRLEPGMVDVLPSGRTTLDA